MSRLKKLYQEMGVTVKNRVNLNFMQETQLREAEEEIIQKEILPIIREQIEPVLNQIKCELILVVDYVPKQAITVSLMRNRKRFNAISGAVEIKPSAQIALDTSSSKSSKENISPRTTSGTRSGNSITKQDVLKRTFIEKNRETLMADRAFDEMIEFALIPIGICKLANKEIPREIEITPSMSARDIAKAQKHNETIKELREAKQQSIQILEFLGVTEIQSRLSSEQIQTVQDNILKNLLFIDESGNPMKLKECIDEDGNVINYKAVKSNWIDAIIAMVDAPENTPRRIVVKSGKSRYDRSGRRVL